MKKTEVIKVTCKLNTSIYPIVIESLKEIGITKIHTQAARSIVLREKKSLFGLSIGISKLEDDQIVSFFFYIPLDYEDTILNFIFEKGRLNIPGRGTIFSEKIELINENFDIVNTRIDIVKEDAGSIFTNNLIGITCIVQRGEGETIARMILDRGFCVPSITFGQGSGLRDKLGLIRIAISSEKEIISAAINKIDAYELFNILIYEGKFDRPGKGFIYMYPIRKGIINTKIYRGTTKHTASIEEMIAAIDDLKGTTEWRDKGSSMKIEEGVKNGKFIENQINLTFICNEGKARDLIKSAMDNGAKGATISNHSYVNLYNETKFNFSHSREGADLIVTKNCSNDIINSLKENKIFSEENSGLIEISDINLSYTYTVQKK